MTITSTELKALMYDLPLLVAATRRRRRQSVRAAAAKVGVASSTMFRIESSKGDCDVHTLILILRWIETE